LRDNLSVKVSPESNIIDEEDEFEEFPINQLKLPTTFEFFLIRSSFINKIFDKSEE
jgi:hypothetical protein